MELVDRHRVARESCQNAIRNASTNLSPVQIVWDENHPLQAAMRSVRMLASYPEGYLPLETPMTEITVDGKKVPLDSHLLNLGNQAHFGQGTETKMDLKVRDAQEITADRLCAEEWKEVFPDIAESLAEMLNFQPFMVIPYKLQMYGVNGHFKKHTDTLHHANHVATLLIRLPTTFTGGELLLDKYKWDPYPNPHLDYIAFFTDTPHEVKPVKSGFRAMLQFEVYLENPADPTLPRERAWYIYTDSQKPVDIYDEDPVCVKIGALLGTNEEVQDLIVHSAPRPFQQQAIQAALENELDQGHIPCFLLEHMYPKDGLQQALFKGADQTLKLMFESMGYAVMGVPATLKGEWDYDGVYKDSVSISAWNCAKLPSAAKTPADWRIFYDPGQMHYMYTLKKKETIAHTGNECAPGHLVAVTGIMLVFRREREVSAAKRVRAS